MVNILNTFIQGILSTNEKLVFIAIRQRAKFEGWLKFELANALREQYKRIYVEHHIPNAKESSSSSNFVDIYADGALIELKTPNTNYRNELCMDLTRPITMNVASIIADINKLKAIDPQSDNHYIAFVMFPLDKDKAYEKHIAKIRTHLRDSVETIAQIAQVPVLIFTGKV